jgi:hypothetical protein
MTTKDYEGVKGFRSRLHANLFDPERKGSPLEHRQRNTGDPQRDFKRWKWYFQGRPLLERECFAVADPRFRQGGDIEEAFAERLDQLTVDTLLGIR